MSLRMAGPSIPSANVSRNRDIKGNSHLYPPAPPLRNGASFKSILLAHCYRQISPKALKIHNCWGSMNAWCSEPPRIFDNILGLVLDGEGNGVHNWADEFLRGCYTAGVHAIHLFSTVMARLTLASASPRGATSEQKQQATASGQTRRVR